MTEVLLSSITFEEQVVSDLIVKPVLSSITFEEQVVSDLIVKPVLSGITFEEKYNYKTKMFDIFS